MNVAAPIIDWVGNVPIAHGERDDSEMCLCGRPVYYECPEWSPGGVAGLVVRVEKQPGGRGPWRWHYSADWLDVFGTSMGIGGWARTKSQAKREVAALAGYDSGPRMSGEPDHDQ